MTTTVKYGRFEPYTVRGGGPARPYIPVRLQNGGISRDTMALVDSGADSSLFHVEWAALLGLHIDPGKAVVVTGIGGGTKCWFLDLYISVAKNRFPAKVGFTEMVSKDAGLLGRADFFQAFDVGFDQRGARVLFHELR